MDTGQSPDITEQISQRKELMRVANFRQYSWYFFALGIYLFCAGAGFLIAYFAVRFMVNMKVHP